jgi:hypothetical protein
MFFYAHVIALLKIQSMILIIVCVWQVLLCNLLFLFLKRQCRIFWMLKLEKPMKRDSTIPDHRQMTQIRHNARAFENRTSLFTIDHSIVYTHSTTLQSLQNHIFHHHVSSDTIILITSRSNTSMWPGRRAREACTSSHARHWHCSSPPWWRPPPASSAAPLRPW